MRSTARILSVMLATALLAACDQTVTTPNDAVVTDPAVATPPAGSFIGMNAVAMMGSMLPEPDRVTAEAQAALRGVSAAGAPGGASAGGLPVVLVRSGFSAGNGRGAVVGNLADALDRVASGGTIRIFPGSYVVDAVLIDKPVTIVGQGGRPVIRNQDAPTSFDVANVPSGTVTFRGLDFQLQPASRSSVNARDVYDEVVVDDCTFDITGSTTGVESGSNDTGTGRVLVTNSHFRYGAVGVFAYLGGRIEVRGSTFADHTSGALQFQSGSSAYIEDNDIGPCGFWGCVRAFGSTVEVVGNRIGTEPTAADGYFHHAILLFTHASGRVEGNEFDGCGHGQCVTVSNRSEAEVIGNTFVIDPTHASRFAVAVADGFGGANPDFANFASFALVTDNVIHASGASVADRNDPNAYALIFGAFLAENGGVLHAYRNQVENADMGVSVNEWLSTGPVAGSYGGTLVGSDNTFTLTRLAIGVWGQSTAHFRSNDFTDYIHPIGEGGRVDPSDLTCNWWGNDQGPQNVAPWIDPSLYTPWATEPVAGQSVTTCGGAP